MKYIKANWQTVKLDDLCLIERGGSPRPINHYLTNSQDGINWIKIGDAKINSKYIDSTTEKIIPAGVNYSRKVNVGDLILSNSMSYGRPYILNIDGCVHDGWLVFSDISNCVDKEYLYYILSSAIVKKQFENEARGAIVKNLNIDIVKNVVIPLPSIEEQKLLVKTIEAKLTVTEKANTAAVEQISILSLIKDKIYESLFDEYCHKQVTLESICTDISDGTHFTPTYVNNGVPFLSVKDLTHGYISFEKCRYITAEEHKNLIKRCNPQYGDILYTKVGTTGIAKAIDIKKEFSIFVSVALLKLKDDISSVFIEKMLNLPFCKKQAEKLTQGATNKNLVIKDLKKIKLYCPDYTDQMKIVDKITKIDIKFSKIKELLSEQQSYINALSSSILRKAFNGEF